MHTRKTHVHNHDNNPHCGIVMGLTFLSAGVLGLLDALEVIAVSWPAVGAGALVVFGVMGVIRGVHRRKSSIRRKLGAETGSSL